MAKTLYFIVDATHPDFLMIKAEAEVAWKINHPNSEFSWFYNVAGNKVEAKVEGFTDNWWDTSPFNGHPAILGVYSKDPTDVHQSFDLLVQLLQTPEWYDDVEHLM